MILLAVQVGMARKCLYLICIHSKNASNVFRPLMHTTPEKFKITSHFEENSVIGIV